MGASFLFLYLFLSLPLSFTCLFLYLLISSFLYFLFLRSFFVSFFLTFFSIFLEPEPKLFRVTWVNKLHWHRQIRCSGIFRLFRCSGLLRGVPECSRVFRCSRVPVFPCSRVPVFLVLVHAILLTIFDNAWQNSVKWLLRARQIRSTSDANMEHTGEENSTWVFRFRVAQVCSLSFQIKFGNAWQNPIKWPLRDI